MSTTPNIPPPASADGNDAVEAEIQGDDEVSAALACVAPPGELVAVLEQLGVGIVDGQKTTLSPAPL